MLDKIIEEYNEVEFIIAEGFDKGVIGMDVNTMRLIYSIHKCKVILFREGMSEIDAEEYLWYNVITAHAGDKTPIWCDDEF